MVVVEGMRDDVVVGLTLLLLALSSRVMVMTKISVTVVTYTRGEPVGEVVGTAELALVVVPLFTAGEVVAGALDVVGTTEAEVEGVVPFPPPPAANDLGIAGPGNALA